MADGESMFREGRVRRTGASWLISWGLGGGVLLAACGGEPTRPVVAAPPPPSSTASVAAPPTAAPTVVIEAPPVLKACPMKLPAEPEGAQPRKEVSSRERQLFLDYWACSLLAGGRVACWGGGQLTKDEEWTNASVVPGLTDVVDVDRGGDRLCGLTSAGKVECVRVGKYPASPPRAPFEGLKGVAEIEGRCARMVDGQVKCVEHLKNNVVTMGLLAGASRLYPFQEGACGLVGTKAICATSWKPIMSADLQDVIEMDTNHGVFCGQSADGGVRCRDPWGYDKILELEGLRGTTQLTVTRGSACGIGDGGQVVCSALVAGSDVGIQGGKTGFEVPGVDHARSLALTMEAGCAILEDGRVACFRLSRGDAQMHPPCVTPITGAVEIRTYADARIRVFCVRRTGGEVLCFEPDSDIRRVDGLP